MLSASLLGEMTRRAPIGHCRPITSSGRKTLRRCKNKEEVDNVVLIDVDSDDFDNVIIIDVPEPVPQKQGSSVLRKDKNGPFETVICIDDDEIAENSGEFSSYGSSSTRSCPASNHSRNSEDAVGDECEFVQEITSPVKLSKGKRTYSGNVRNRYGLTTESVSVSSDDDMPDCQVVEDTFVREQWEKASLKRKYDSRDGQSCMRDQASASMFHSDAQPNVETENRTEQRAEHMNCSASGSGENITTGYSNLDTTSHNPERNPFTDFGLKQTEKTQFCHGKVDVEDIQQSFTADPPFKSTESQSDKHVEHRGSSFCNEDELCSREQPLNYTKGRGNKQVNNEKYVSGDNRKPPLEESFSSKSQPMVDINMGSSKGSFPDEVPSLSKSGDSVETVVDHGGFVSRNSCNDADLIQGKSLEANAVVFEPTTISKQLVDESDYASSPQDGDTTRAGQESIINEREKLKETDEYKRAVEEEWASRQRELQIQAEEAQQLRRLRRRKKAESMRLLDMERRQKQRLEEMRETQKKDEENMNLKEQLRAEVRKELNILETTCCDMVSLLRGLGIDVSLPNEVRAAYKRALLSFHPDRASGSDIRQLVEAEEKFKLISRMKEKFLSTS